MQPTLCSRCKKNVAVIFITRLEGGQAKNEGLCLKCARELHIKPVDDVINKMGLSDDELDVWDESLALRAAKITALRAAYIERLQEFCHAVQAELSGGEEELVLSYESQVDPRMAEADIAAAYLERLRYDRGTDLLNGVTGAGAHRDDLGIELNSAPLKKYGSQGQKRSAVLALKLAEGMVLEQVFGYSPVFLLDDVLSELDEGRREYILSKIEGRQVIITGCTRESAPADTVRYYVKDGRAVED